MNKTERYLGLMSGTSLDGIDAALAEFDGTGVRLLATLYRPYAPELQERLKSICYGRTVEFRVLGELDARLGMLLGETANALLAQSGIARGTVRAIGSHGQTVYHQPDGDYPFTWQIGDPNRIAEMTGLPVVADLRRRDVAAGGQGAPLAPGFHRAMFHSGEESRVVVNIGGIANITVLPKPWESRVYGFDAGPGNTFLDLWIRRERGLPFDEDGAWAASGKVSADLLAALLDDAYFAAPPPKSTGQEYFSANWLETKLAGFALPSADVQATLGHLTARSLADAIRRHAPDTRRVFVCGGGARNGWLMAELAGMLDCPVQTTAALGMEPDWVEAVAFAWLARQTLHGQAGNLPEVTGAAHPVVLGGMYAG